MTVVSSIAMMLCRIFTRAPFCYVLPSSLYLKLFYFKHTGMSLELKSPVSFNHKLQWLKLHDRNPRYTTLVDKLQVRDFVAKIIGTEHLVPLLHVYDTADAIDFDKLPSRFVLKTNHDSGAVVVCKDKAQLDIDATRAFLSARMKRNYYWRTREWPYKNISPKILCEAFLEDPDYEIIPDYKLMCFNGKVLCSFIVGERHLKQDMYVDFYDREWNKMPFSRKYRTSDIVTPKPKNYDKMLQIAEQLSEDIPFVRVDLYNINGQIYFGELTLYPGGGTEQFSPIEYDNLLGSWLALPEMQENT